MRAVALARPRSANQTGVKLGVPKGPWLGNFEQGWVIRDRGAGGRAERVKGALSRTCVENWGLKMAPQVGLGSEHGIDSIEDIDFIAMVQRIWTKMPYLDNGFVTCNSFLKGPEPGFLEDR